MSVANEMTSGGNPEGTSEGRDLRQSAQGVKDAVTEKAGELRDRASAMYEQGKDKAQLYYEQGKAAAGEYWQQGSERAREFEHDVESYIRQKPIQSVLIAVGVGVVLGALLKR